MRGLLIFAISLVVGFVLTVMMAGPAHCVWCPTYTCFGSCGMDNCVCVTAPGTSGGGKCYGMERAAELELEGWRVIE